MWKTIKKGGTTVIKQSITNSRVIVNKANKAGLLKVRPSGRGRYIPLGFPLPTHNLLPIRTDAKVQWVKVHDARQMHV